MQRITNPSDTALIRFAKSQFICPNTGVKYTGEWIGDKRDGQGLQVWPNGTSYQGQWVNDFPDGFGIFKKPNGDSLEGQWKSGRAHGIATFTQIV